jgi:hypothetical protein
VIRLVCSNLATHPSMVFRTGLPAWALEVVIDLDEVFCPEWCEVCADLEEDRVPARATTTAGGARVCADCADSWVEMTGPTVVAPFVSMGELVHGSVR